ncbi:HAD family hydrolase [Methanocella arvoryzae]|uniref:Beta-phosphoglucomutase n=1 Tax=Methanocella arvoryzae (strain DSM 22066 / NBRC 105507 / MRE50) TaxID=351160 RepID=Q0W893_METAR|nr:HAD family phosphatase [Methanocella arvoryzae]CAJ35400.1 beta-phosphoglucomutase [Methanocella arvoryzae MRE50]
MARTCRIDTDRYKAVLFDLDGVITDTMSLHYEAYRRAFEKYGIAVSQLDIYLLEGMPSMDVGREIVRLKGSNLQEEQIRKLVEEKREIYRSLTVEHALPYPAVPETLRMLREQGIKLALITGSNLVSVRKTLSKAGLENAFDTIVTGDDTPRGKPFPEPYLKGMEKLGVPGENCVVVENAPLGIKSAKAAGAGYVIAVTTTLPPEYLKEADDIMQSFAEIEDCLARRLAASKENAQDQ